MKRNLLLFVSLFIVQISFSNLLYDITDGNFKPKTLPSFHSMQDGEHYTIMHNKTAIVKYNYKTGAFVDTVFSIYQIANSPIKEFTGYEFSPNEELVMLYTNEEYRYRRTFTADYYIYNIQKKRLNPLSEYGKQEASLFSPNSRYVAFVRENNIFIRKLDFNTELAVTKDGEKGKIINGVPDWVYEEEFGSYRYFEWSPDSKLLAYVKLNETEIPEFSFQIFNNKKEDELDLYPDYLNFKYPKAGEKNSKVSVYIYEDYNKTTRKIDLEESSDDYYIPRIKWTANSDQLAIFKLNRNQNQLDMYLANPKSTVAKIVLTESDKYYIDYGLIDCVQFFQDNSGFLFVSERDGYRHAYKYRINGLLDKQLTKGEWDVTDIYGYDEKNNVLYYQSAEASPLKRDIYALDSKGKKTALTDGKGTHNAKFNSTYTYFVDDASSIDVPNQIILRTNKGKSVRVLEDNKALKEKFDALNLPKKEFFTFKTAENVELNGWVVKPLNFDVNRKYPVLFVQYSGPNSQQVTDRWRIDWEYYLAQNDYVVVCVDGRGTGARGAEFRKCTYQQLGVLETKDQIESAKYFANQSYIDSKRMGIWGWSYGGFMTLMTMSEKEQIFKAGIAVAPVTDWRLYNTAYTERFMRRPQENFKGYEVTSPLLKVNDLKGNLLMIHGTADDNVHVQNTMLYIEKLVEADKQFEMQLYTDKNHSILGKQARRHLYKRKYDFLLKNL